MELLLNNFCCIILDPADMIFLEHKTIWRFGSWIEPFKWHTFSNKFMWWVENQGVIMLCLYWWNIKLRKCTLSFLNRLSPVHRFNNNIPTIWHSINIFRKCCYQRCTSARKWSQGETLFLPSLPKYLGSRSKEYGRTRHFWITNLKTSGSFVEW